MQGQGLATINAAAGGEHQVRIYLLASDMFALAVTGGRGGGGGCKGGLWRNHL